MSKAIRRAAVIGGGVMGSGIMAHFANAGLDVVLLDIVPPKLNEEEKKQKTKRNAFADGGLQNALKARPAAFFHPSLANRVTTGNLEDNLDLLKNCDLVIEAIIENLDIKKSLFAKLEGVISHDTVIASNTSGLRIHDMVQGRADWFRKNFLVMHFFNPVRYMKLLELVAGPDTDPSTLARIRKFGEEQLGKGIVIGRDTPNFVGNRIGCYAMTLTMQKMLEHKLSPEDVDAITGPPMAHPSSASFRTADVVGLDTFKHVSDNCYAALTDDPEREVFKVPEFMNVMVQKGLLGNKTKGGFYRKNKDGSYETFDPHKLEYRPKAGNVEIKKLCKEIEQEPDAAARVKKLVSDSGPAGEFAWEILSRSMLYSAKMIGEITDDIEAIDHAMQWGYSWELGPFETWDAIGFEEGLKRMKADGLKIPANIEKMAASGAGAFYESDQVYSLTQGRYVKREVDPRTRSFDLRRKSESAVFENRGAGAWDLGDGVLGLRFKTKANSIDDNIIEALNQAVDTAEKDFRALVIYNEGTHFSVGANLMAVAMAAQQKMWDQLRGTVNGFQGAVQRMKYSTIPVVAAPYGMVLGGGLEVCLGCDAVQASAETYAGLVEVGVGLIPGGAGNVNLVWRAMGNIPDGALVDPFAFIQKVFENIALARVSSSALEAQELGYFKKGDGISFDKARLLAEAKARAVGLASAGYHPPPRKRYRLPGESGIATLHMIVDTLVAGGQASQHDALIAKKLACVVCGGPSGHAQEMSEEQVLEIEREVFISLCGEPKSLERMQHMLMNNKPLRN